MSLYSGIVKEAVVEAVNETRMECARAVCHVCKEEGPPTVAPRDYKLAEEVIGKPVGDLRRFHHVIEQPAVNPPQVSVFCSAEPIWKLIFGEA